LALGSYFKDNQIVEDFVSKQEPAWGNMRDSLENHSLNQFWVGRIYFEITLKNDQVFLSLSSDHPEMIF